MTCILVTSPLLDFLAPTLLVMLCDGHTGNAAATMPHFAKTAESVCCVLDAKALFSIHAAYTLHTSCIATYRVMADKVWYSLQHQHT